MLEISALIEALKKQLHTIDGEIPTQVTITHPCEVSEVDLLSFLEAQSIFPNMYWFGREGDEEVVACGAYLLFTHIHHAQTYLSEHPKADYTIWGINGFEPDRLTKQVEHFYFIPRMELRLQERCLIIRLNLDELGTDVNPIANALVWLEQLTPVLAEKKREFTTTVVASQHYPEKQGWHDLIEHALTAIDDGCFSKVVLARKTTYQLQEELNPLSLIKRSKDVNYSCYHFVIRFSQQQAFMGSSPERLFYRCDEKLMTEALAGTVASSADSQERAQLGQWLLNDEKNRRENQFVVNDIKSRIELLVTSLEVAPIDIISLRNVQHLVQRIKSKLNYVDDTECLYQLQPTAAVAGLPRAPAIEFIIEKEPFSRGWYAGSIGFLSNKRSEFSVSLRSAFVEGNYLHLYAGAGIVSGSDPDSEWTEIENKAAGLRSLFLEK